MGRDTVAEVPAGFERVPAGFGFTDAVQPVYRRVSEGGVSFGLVVQPHHGNSMGICHGAVLMTLADMTATSGVNHACGVLTGNPTVNLSIDFIAAAREGEWLQADVEHVTVKRRFGFSNGVICNQRGIVARFNGTIYLPDHEGMLKDGRRGDGPLGSPPGSGP